MTALPSPRATIAVCTYDGGRLANLDALAEALPPDAEVVVVDASRNDVRFVENRRASLERGFRHVPASPPSLASQRNRAAREARGEILVFLDDDCFPRPGWLAALLEAVGRGADVATARILEPEGLHGPYSETFRQDKGEKPRTFTRKDLRVLPPLRFLFRAYGGDASVAPWACGTGSSFAVRLSLWTSLGGFREDLGPGTPAMQGEDVDFFLRALAAGARIAYEPASVVEHRHVRRTDEDYLRTAFTYSRGARAVLASSLRIKPAYLAALVGRPFHLAALAATARIRGERETAAMSASALRGWVGLPPPRSPGGRA